MRVIKITFFIILHYLFRLKVQPTVSSARSEGLLLAMYVWDISVRTPAQSAEDKDAVAVLRTSRRLYRTSRRVLYWETVTAATVLPLLLCMAIKTSISTFVS